MMLKQAALSLRFFWLIYQTEKGIRDIWVDLTLVAAKWIVEQEETEQQPEMVDAMRKAYEYMMGRKSRRDELIGAKIRRPYWLNLQVPGDRVGLDPRGYNAPLDEKGKLTLEGYKLLPHNIDSTLQQLLLIMGIAALGMAVFSKRVK